MRRIAVLLIAVVSLGLFTGLAAAGGGKGREGTIVEELAGQENFSTLVALVQEAGLADALSGDTELTLFAPTNKAFERLAARDPELFQAVLASPELLTAVLLYHVAAGEIDAATIVGLSSVPTLQGGEVAVSIKNGFVRLNARAENAKVYRPDIQATNGVIHGITEVLIPPLG
jgi:transforming growth factor-beta-induced protein